MFETFPRSNAADSDFRDKDVDMRIPLKTATKGVKDTDKAGSKSFSLIELAEHIKDDIANGMKEAIEQRTISVKEDAELFRNGKDTMSVNTLNEFKGHRSSALDRIEIAA